VAQISDTCIDTIIWVEFVVSSLPCSERYSSGTPAFFCPQKPTFPNSTSARNQVDEEPKSGRGLKWLKIPTGRG